MALDRRLLSACLDLAPAQPATALWRAVEVGHLVRQDVLPRSGTGLDLGCGDGRVTRLVRDELGARWTLTGLDPDELELELATSCGIYDVLLRADGGNVDAQDESFDFVFSNSVLEHVDELEPLLAEVGRVLRRGGRFVFTVPSVRFHENLGGPGALGRLATGASDPIAYHRALDARLAHVRYLSGAEWKARLASIGLDVVHESTYLGPEETQRWATVSNATAGVLVRLRGGRPIDVQRALGLRRARPPLGARAVGSTIGRVAAVRLRADEATTGSCLLIVAVKQSVRDAT